MNSKPRINSKFGCMQRQSFPLYYRITCSGVLLMEFAKRGVGVGSKSNGAVCSILVGTMDPVSTIIRSIVQVSRSLGRHPTLHHLLTRRMFGRHGCSPVSLHNET